jgi:UDP-N-acetylmuramoylalanine--D-glutamate ligase
LTLSAYIDTLRGKKVAVAGIGISNRPLLDLLVSAGIDVSARDKNAVDVSAPRSRFGDGYLDCREEDVVFRSPGIMPRFIELKPGAVLISEMELFFELCPCPIIGVTGSDCKTTTTALIAELLKANGRTVHLGGNIGNPLLTELDAISPNDYAVVELSSFQLIGMKRSPHIAVITNISPNHLDKHNDYDEYIAAKSNIYLWQKPGDRLIFGGNIERGSVEPAKLLGEHNKINFSVAAEAVRGIVSDAAIRRVAENFSGVEHRLECVRERNGVRYYNASIASSPSRTIANLRSFEQKVILIAGGADKGVPFDELGPVIAERVKTLVLTGPTSQKILDAVYDCGRSAPPHRIIDSFDDAVRCAASIAKPGDVVLLSPASTSFDAFKNFEERGNRFKQIVMEL